MKLHVLLPVAVLLVSAPCVFGGDLAVTRSFVPKDSPLAKQVGIDRPLEDIKAAIMKLIPLGTSQEAAQKLFAIHMPKDVRKRHQLAARGIPVELKDKPYICFQLVGSTSFRHFGSQWIEVLFFFEDGKLSRIHVGLGSVVL